MQIGEYAPVPCGGTHVATLAEIDGISIRKISTKNDRTKISYEVT
jgi:alanyl-tRNA synthetase